MRPWYFLLFVVIVGIVNQCMCADQRDVIPTHAYTIAMALTDSCAPCGGLFSYSGNLNTPGKMNTIGFAG